MTRAKAGFFGGPERGEEGGRCGGSQGGNWANEGAGIRGFKLRYDVWEC